MRDAQQACQLFANLVRTPEIVVFCRGVLAPPLCSRDVVAGHCEPESPPAPATEFVNCSLTRALPHRYRCNACARYGTAGNAAVCTCFFYPGKQSAAGRCSCVAGCDDTSAAPLLYHFQVPGDFEVLQYAKISMVLQFILSESRVDCKERPALHSEYLSASCA